MLIVQPVICTIVHTRESKHYACEKKKIIQHLERPLKDKNRNSLGWAQTHTLLKMTGIKIINVGLASKGPTTLDWRMLQTSGAAFVRSLTIKATGCQLFILLTKERVRVPVFNWSDATSVGHSSALRFVVFLSAARFHVLFFFVCFFN